MVYFTVIVHAVLRCSRIRTLAVFFRGIPPPSRQKSATFSRTDHQSRTGRHYCTMSRMQGVERPVMNCTLQYNPITKHMTKSSLAPAALPEYVTLGFE